MNDNKQNSTVVCVTDIRIVGLNTDKTGRMIGSETIYQVYGV